MKVLVIIVLLVLGFYWTFDHYAPFPLNHESLHLYQHNIHRFIGVGFFIAAALTAIYWKPKKNN